MGSMEGARVAHPQEGSALALSMTSGEAGSGLRPAHAGSFRGAISEITGIGG